MNLNKTKPVADTGFGFDALGVVWIQLDLLPEVSDMDAQVVDPFFRIRPPNFPKDLAMGQNFPRVMDE